MLGERERHSLEDFERMQLDFYSLPGVETVHRLSRLHPSGQRERPRDRAAEELGRPLDADTIAGTIYHAFTRALRAGSCRRP